MGRGKYTARAANREAARDNERIAGLCDQVAALKADLAAAQAALRAEQAERGSLVTARSRELAAEEIAAMKADLDTERAERAAVGERTVRWMMWYFNVLMKELPPTVKMLPEMTRSMNFGGSDDEDSFPDIMNALIGPERAGEYLALLAEGLKMPSLANRVSRRLHADDYRATADMTGRLHSDGQHRLLLDMKAAIARKNNQTVDGL